MVGCSRVCPLFLRVSVSDSRTAPVVLDTGVGGSGISASDSCRPLRRKWYKPTVRCISKRCHLHVPDQRYLAERRRSRLLAAYRATGSSVYRIGGRDSCRGTETLDATGAVALRRMISGRSGAVLVPSQWAQTGVLVLDLGSGRACPAATLGPPHRSARRCQALVFDTWTEPMCSAGGRDIIYMHCRD